MIYDDLFHSANQYISRKDSFAEEEIKQGAEPIFFFSISDSSWGYFPTVVAVLLQTPTGCILKAEWGFLAGEYGSLCIPIQEKLSEKYRGLSATVEGQGYYDVNGFDGYDVAVILSDNRYFGWWCEYAPQEWSLLKQGIRKLLSNFPEVVTEPLKGGF